MKFKTLFLTRLLSIFFFSIFFVPCSNTSSITTEKKEKGMSYLALGDSYTIGELVDENQNFPNQLVRALGNKGYTFQTPTIIAKTGWRTDELLNGIKEANIKKKVDLVSILIGVNNQYQNKSIDVFKEDLNLIIDQAILYSKKGTENIFAFSIPDYSVMPAMRGKSVKKISSEIKEYNAIYHEICKIRGIAFYDVTRISRLAKDDTSLIADDKLHPNEKMYEMWVQKNVDRIIEDVLN